MVARNSFLYLINWLGPSNLDYKKVSRGKIQIESGLRITRDSLFLRHRKTKNGKQVATSSKSSKKELETHYDDNQIVTDFFFDHR